MYSKIEQTQETGQIRLYAMLDLTCSTQDADPVLANNIQAPSAI